jgi:hypothetical protein
LEAAGGEDAAGEAAALAVSNGVAAGFWLSRVRSGLDESADADDRAFPVLIWNRLPIGEIDVRM